MKLPINKSIKESLVLIALGIAFGDIGTSPLYTLRACFKLSNIALTQQNILGFVSLIIWSLILVVAIKYILFVLKVNNKGEGGIIILVTSVIVYFKQKKRRILTLFGLLGGCFFLGDAVITPAISVLSSVEGLITIYPAFGKYTTYLAIIILCGLFYIQKQGTLKIGRLFGPIMLAWFLIIGIVGLYNITLYPYILSSLNPIHGIKLLCHGGLKAFISMGAVVLALTGAESLYADLGHCSLSAIKKAWTFLVLPSLSLNYIGQGALLSRNIGAIENPFFLSFPTYLLIPVVIFSCIVAIIASQAVISGTFSLISQAINLRYLPRMKIIYTSEEVGQIYMPFINFALFILVMITVVLFKSTDHLTSAYGLSITATMTITSILFFIFVITKLRWNKLVASMCILVFLTLDITFLSANLMKFFDGGWYPFAITMFLFAIFVIWIKGKQKMNNVNNSANISFYAFMEKIVNFPPQIIKNRNAIFLVENFNSVPNALIQNIVHNKVLHETSILLTIKTTNNPHIYNKHSRIRIKKINKYFYRIIAKYGFKETPDIKQICKLISSKGINLNIADSSFFLSNQVAVIGKKNNIFSKIWLTMFYILYKNRITAHEFYKIPLQKFIEIGYKVELNDSPNKN